MSERIASKDLQPGTVMEFRDGRRVVLHHRKDPELSTIVPFHPGWWCDDGSGLADFVVDAEDSAWRVVRD